MSKTLQNILTTFRKMESLPQCALKSFVNLHFLIEHSERLDKARSKYFTDQKGQTTFDWVIQNRLLNSFYGYPVPEVLDNIPYPKKIWDRLVTRAESMPPVAKGDYLYDRIDTWLLECYSLKGLCEVEPGDIVLDCGTYTGNTSIYFSKKTGATGRVYGFEPVPSTFETYLSNVAPYSNIIPVNAGLTNREQSGSILAMNSDSPGASFATDGKIKVSALAVDSFCASHSIERVDFIKMDIEGAELDALHGAEQTIRAHRPKMTLSAYHKSADLFALPDYISSICPGYRFTLRHFSDRSWETVLFCRHTDDKEYFGGPNTADSPENMDKNELYKNILFLLLPYLLLSSPSALITDEGIAKALTSAENIFNYAVDTSKQVEELLKKNEKLLSENFALRKILEKGLPRKTDRTNS